ncbi:hypothetical protein GOODEAATRI_002957, partial [Goodea atripinnis]
VSVYSLHVRVKSCQSEFHVPAVIGGGGGARIHLPHLFSCHCLQDTAITVFGRHSWHSCSRRSDKHRVTRARFRNKKHRRESEWGGVWPSEILRSLLAFVFMFCLQKLEEQDRKALNVKEQLQREHRYLKRRLEQLSVSGSVERIRTDSMGSTISTDSEQEVDIEGMEFTPVEADSVDSISDGEEEEEEEEEEEDHYSVQSSSSDTSYTAAHSHRLQPHHC